MKKHPDLRDPSRADTNPKWRVIFTAACVLLGTLTGRAESIDYEFVPLGLADSAGDAAHTINNLGQVTGTVDGFDAVSRGYLYDGTLTRLVGIADDGTLLGRFQKAETGSANRYFLFRDNSLTEVVFGGEEGWGRYTPSGLGENGEIVGSFQTDGDDLFHGFISRPAATRFTFATFDVDGAKETLLADIRNDGTLVGRYRDQADLSHGFVQSDETLTSFNVTGSTTTFACGIGEDGRVVGFYYDAADPTIQHGFIRATDGTYVTIDGPGNINTTYLWRLNTDGRINGYVFDSEPFFIRSFKRETDGMFNEFVFPGSPVGTVTRGMNEAGDLVGWKWTDAFALQGVVFRAVGTTNVFTIPDWANTLPGDINEQGDIAGTVINAEFSDRRGFFLRSDGTVTVFAPPGAVETEVFGMNDAGMIVGEYVDAAGKRHGFIAKPGMTLDMGEVDIGLAYEEGELEFHAHDETNDVEYSPDMAVLAAGTTAEQPIPDTVDFTFLGEPGRSAWILPQAEDESLLFLGLAAEEVESGLFVNDALRAELVSVDGAGDFFLYTTDAFGAVNVHMNSADGISGPDFFPLIAGSHQHVNWAFNAPGSYRVGLRAAGTLVAENESLVGEVFYFTFDIPEAELPQPVEPDDSIVYKVIELGTFGGTLFNTAIDVNNEGVVVGGSSLENNIDHPIFRWEDGMLENLGLIGGRTAGANAISETGWIVGTSTTPAGDFEPYVPYRRTANGVFEQIPLILGAQNGEAHDVNDDGTTVGTLDLPDLSSRAFLSPANAATIDLGTFGGEQSGAEGINNSGVIVGWALLANGQQRAFRHTGTGPLDPATDDLGTLGGNSSRATAVSETGRVVGRSRDANGMQRAFLWEQGTGMQDLGTLGGGNTWAFDINTNDEVVGWGTLDPADTFADHTHGWVWNAADGMRDLNTLVPAGTGLEIISAYGINDSGWIAGGGELPDSSTRPLLLKPATRLKRGEVDLGFAWEDGELEFHVHDHSADVEYEAEEVVLHVAALGQTHAQEGLGFLGSIGAPVWILPQSENPKLLFLGLAAEEVEAGVFVDDELELRLFAVDGPGDLSGYSVDGFGQPNVYMNSGDGIDPNDRHILTVGAHEHVNWGFTAPGLYRVTFQGFGTVVEGGVEVQTEEVEICFEVIGIEAQLDIAFAGSDGTVSFTTQDGIVYQLQSAPTVNGPWTDLGQRFIGTGRAKQLGVPVTGPAGYFQVRIMETP